MKSTTPGFHLCLKPGPAAPVFSLLYALIFICPSVTFAFERTIALTNGCVPPGYSTQIEIRLSEVEGLAGCDLSIAFDPNIIRILDVDATPLIEDFILSFGTTTPGLLRIAIASAEGLTPGGPGAIATVTVEMASSSMVGTRTALWLSEARWYNDLSVRQRLLGDNAVVEAGLNIPAEDGGIVFSLDSCHGQPGNSITSGVWTSLPAGVARMEAILTYDAVTLLSPSLVLAPSLMGWSKEVHYSSGQIHFIFSGTTELRGPDPIQIASCTWTISPDAVSESESDIAVSNTQASNLDDFGYMCLDGANTVIVDPPVPLLVNHWEEY